MTRLETILTQYSVTGKLGGAGKFDREYLRSALTGAGRQTAWAFWLAVGTQVAVFAVVCWFVISNASNPRVLSYALGIGGGGVSVLGWSSVRLWREKVATDLTIALVGSLNESAALSVLDVVLQTFRKAETVSGRAASRRRSET